MTDKFPDDIMREARRISCEIGKPGDGLTVRTIARVLMARDFLKENGNG